MFDLESYLAERRRLIDRALEERLPAADLPPACLHEAMRYAILTGGKRLRPILCLAAAEAVGGTLEKALGAALALELLHAYTLVHDDLPCMDDDALRRGLPTVHVKYGEACAVLAGDALQTLAFEWAADQPAGVPQPHALVLELARASGSRGVVGGQMEDLLGETGPHSPERLEFIHRHKTAALLCAAVRMGGLAAGADAHTLGAFTTYGENIGLAFQVADDILNATSTADAIGKPAGTDAQRGKMTYVAVHGLDEARRRARALVDAAIAALDIARPLEPLRAIARYIVERAH